MPGMYIQMEPIKGECTDDKHKDWIEMTSFSHGVHNSVSMGSGTGGLSVGSSTLQDFSFTKIMDKSTSELNLFCSDGSHIAEVIVHLCLNAKDQIPYMEYKFEDVGISNIGIGGSSFDDAKPTETVTFAYAKVTWKFTTQKHDGSKDADYEKFWDLRTNTGG